MVLEANRNEVRWGLGGDFKNSLSFPQVYGEDQTRGVKNHPIHSVGILNTS